MDSISEFKRKYGQQPEKNNNNTYKMEDWFENMFSPPKTRKSSSPKKEKAVEAEVEAPVVEAAAEETEKED